MISRLSLILLFSIACINCSSSNKSTPSPLYKPDFNYKKWFFKTPPGMVVGYPQNLKDSHKDGKVRLSSYKQTRVKGFIRQYSDDLIFDEQDSVFFYYNDRDSAVFNSAIVLDSFILNHYYLYLISPDSQAFDNSKIPIHTSKEYWPASDNVNNNEMLSAKAAETFNYYDQASPWMVAEENAIKQLAQQSVYHFASLQKYIQTGDKEELSETYQITLDLIISNINVVKRYYDPQKKSCNVIVSCRKSDIKPYQEDLQ